MHSEAENNDGDAPKARGIPPAIESAIRRAIALHRREYGNKNYDLSLIHISEPTRPY